MNKVNGLITVACALIAQAGFAQSSASLVDGERGGNGTPPITRSNPSKTVSYGEGCDGKCEKADTLAPYRRMFDTEAKPLSAYEVRKLIGEGQDELYLVNEDDLAPTVDGDRQGVLVYFDARGLLPKVFAMHVSARDLPTNRKYGFERLRKAALPRISTPSTGDKDDLQISFSAAARPYEPTVMWRRTLRLLPSGYVIVKTETCALNGTAWAENSYTVAHVEKHKVVVNQP